MSQIVEPAVMSDAAFANIYKDVPREQWETLIRFRATHPARELRLGGVDWRYLSGGQEGPVLLLLPGAIGRAEVAFRHILELESDYRVIAPNYPMVSTVAALLTGLAGVLNTERAETVTVIGGSMGGGFAQCVVRKYPERVDNLVLSHTGVPNPKRARLSKLGLTVLRLLPIGLVRAGLKWEISRLLSTAGDKREFWLAYFNELISGLTKEEVLRSYELAIDLEQHYAFAPGDLANWPGKIIVLESDNDSVIVDSERTALKALYPQAEVHTFIGAGHAASIIKREEYISVVRAFLTRYAKTQARPLQDRVLTNQHASPQ